MPDSRSAYDMPRGWDDAFAALPLEAPDADRWTSIARRLPVRRSSSRRPHRPYWLAIAAAVALAAVVPVFWWTEHETPPGSDPVATAPAPPAATPAPSKPAATAPVAADAQTRPSASTREKSDSAISATAVTAAVPRLAKPARPLDVSPPQPQDSAASATAMAGSDRRLEDLYAESARLEAILAQLQEPRVTSATAATLSAELQDRVGDIDTALSQADLPSASQQDLWQQRVEALRQLTGVETTRRWMAAQGTATEGSLARVY